jgi:hypothetical protein
LKSISCHFLTIRLTNTQVIQDRSRFRYTKLRKQALYI